jgi:hypothetical protein
MAFFLAHLCSPVPVTWQMDTLQIHNQLVMLSFGIELGIKKFSFVNSGFVIAIVEHPNLKTKYIFLQPINPMLKIICYY